MHSSPAIRRFVTALAVLTMTALAVPASAASAPAAAPSHLDVALRHAPSGVSAQSSRSIDPIDDCFDDNVEDTIISSEGSDDGTSIDVAAADILSHCISYGPTISLSVALRAPTDPFTDPAWQGATFVGWFIDVDADDAGDFFAEVSLTADGSAFVGTITDMTDPDDPTVVCADQGAASTSYGIALDGVARTCIGSPASFSVSPAIFYDYDGGSDTRVAFDNAPQADGFDGPVAAGDAQRPLSRLAGATRIETAIEISKAQFPNGAPVVYLARDGAGDNIFADAVAGGVLTAGPILLVPTCGGIPDSVKAEIARLGATQVIALGGPVAICEANLAEAAGGRATSRLAGETRFTTAVAIAQAQFPNGADTVYLARADVFADAAVGGTVTDGPILLVPSCGAIPIGVTAEIARQGPDRVIAFGGPVAICEDTFRAGVSAAGAAATSMRLAGETRIQTSVAISQHVFPAPSGVNGPPINVHLARADLFADALVGGIITTGPILLIPSCGDLPPSVGNEISRLSPERVIGFGGPVALCDAILAQAAQR